MLGAIRSKLAEFKQLSSGKAGQAIPKVFQNKIRLTDIDVEIKDLLSKVGSANPILMEYINNRIAKLDEERKTLQEEILALTCSKAEDKMDEITNHVEMWDSVSFEDKQTVVDTLIKIIKIANGKIEIEWKI